MATRVKHVLMVVHDHAGLGDHGGEAVVLRRRMAENLGGLVDVELALAEDHADVTARVTHFLERTRGQVAVIAGGGSGTLRSAIDAVLAQERKPSRVALSALRMGSGNVLARRYAVPRDGVQAVDELCVSLREGRRAAAKVVRVETFTAEGAMRVFHAAGLVGLGQLGRVPGDLRLFRSGLKPLHTAAAASLGLERVNHLEYALAFAWRAARVAAFRRAERVRITGPHSLTTMDMVAGVVMTGPIPELPIPTAISTDEPGLSVHLLPVLERGSLARHLLAPERLAEGAWHLRLAPRESVELELMDRPRGALFVDEDMHAWHRRLRICLAAVVPFVPGVRYRGTLMEETHHDTPRLAVGH
ncbi:MAG: diacylglycerol kinase family protein [Myxococcota bacterium]